MCLFTDLQTLDKIDEKSIITYLENLGGYVVVPKTTIKKIESVLKRSSKLAYDKGRISLHNDIKAVLPNE
jgi:hypothetical protein